MKKRTKKRLMVTSITEYKSLEKYFENMALKGWIMKEFKKGMMIFEECEPRDLDFNVSLFYNTTPFDYPDNEKDSEYRELCEESGWTYCASNQLYQVYYKEKNQEVVPIHSDSIEEYNIIKKTYMKTEFISLIALLPMIVVLFWSNSNLGYRDLLSNSGIFGIILPYMLLILVIVMHAPNVIWLIKNKINLSKGNELHFKSNRVIVRRNIVMWTLVVLYLILLIYLVFFDIPHFSFVLIAFAPIVIGIVIGGYCIKRFKTKKRSRKHNILFFTGGIILSLILTYSLLFVVISGVMHSSLMDMKNEMPPENVKVLHLSDFTEIDSVERKTFFKRSSVFAPVSFLYYESINKKTRKDEIRSFNTEYIECINKKIADFVFNQYMKEEFERKIKWAKEAREWGKEERAKEYENDIKEVSIHNWGVDRGYYLYESKRKIIIQKDNIIYILGGDLDFSDKEIINICRRKLGL
ncbi:DUF2812 domain-containing protein [Oceanirhabdus sp. W0125-5]|uniref:DUF2812 domain-containing protein n=1 Tax=Oceanirhabdus sp. W0125-5 TaxID=2999116 RepID=UPI0022F34673|nr:DUF2812 domain-containing protein [Oceanirhabdus sp. W0125-5]WBW99343.1 DUF2812 domain-containing protein [Oceanirhabdus sp. W0125-5]